MLAEYEALPVRYRARLEKLGLVIEEVTPHVYRRVGTAGTGATKMEAIEILKRDIMDDFAKKLGAINYQAQAFDHY